MRIRILAFVALSSVGAATAQATLGERFSSSQFQAQITSSASTYVKHEWEAHGITVDEFSAKSGLVFAVAWRGPRHPDLEQLFGKHFWSYKAARLRASSEHRTRGTLEVKNDDIVVRVGGHMGAVRGFAYVPALVPKGVSVEALK